MRHLLVTILAVPSLLAAQEVSRFDLRDDHVAIYNLVGEATLEAGSGNAVSIEVRRGGPDAGRLTVEHGPIAGRATLRVLYPADQIHYDPPGAWGMSTEVRVRDDGTFSDSDWTDDRVRGRRVRISSRGGGLDAFADLRIQVPRGRRVALYVAAGPITVRNVDGTLRVDGGSSAVTASGTRGSLTVDVGSGTVEVSDAEDVDVDTGSGDVTVTDARGEMLRVDTGSGSVHATRVTVRRLDIDTGSGGVRVESATADQVVIDTGSGSVHAAVGGTVSDVEIDTGSGSVTLVLPADYGATVDIESGSGGIDLDFPVQVRRVEQDHVRGTIGDGSGRLKIDTGSGRISIRRG